MEPMTMIAIAQAGMQLYGMLRGGGGGGGESLLSAQTRMLAEISKQIEVLNGKLVLIQKSLQELKELVRKLPGESAIAATRLALEGYFIHAGEILGTFSEHELRWGRAKAVSMVQQETSLLLNDLNSARSSLISDRSETLCPIVAASWYIELQLMGNCIPFDATRLAYVGRSYDKAFSSWLSNVIYPELKETTREVVAVRDSIKGSSDYANYACNHSIKGEVKHRSGGGGGPHGDSGGSPESWTYTVSAQRSTLTAKSSPILERLQIYRSALETLAATGIEIDSAYKEIEPLEWVATTGNYGSLSYTSRDRKDPSRYNSALAGLKQNECKESPGFAERFAAQENPRAALSENLFLKTLVYGNYLLVCQEAQKSTRSIIERAARTA